MRMTREACGMRFTDAHRRARRLRLPETATTTMELSFFWSVSLELQCTAVAIGGRKG